jgi:hypothetical protein
MKNFIFFCILILIIGGCKSGGSDNNDSTSSSTTTTIETVATTDFTGKYGNLLNLRGIELTQSGATVTGSACTCDSTISTNRIDLSISGTVSGDTLTASLTGNSTNCPVLNFPNLNITLNASNTLVYSGTGTFCNSVVGSLNESADRISTSRTCADINCTLINSFL